MVMNNSIFSDPQKPLEWPQVEQHIQLAASAFYEYRYLPVSKRIAFLTAIAVELAEFRENLIDACNRETYLPIGRLHGELDRTINQIYLFVSLLKEGAWVNAIIDTGIPDRHPVARPDIRQMQLPLGPVCVYGASNFPFAFSVVGGDTVSALAAGCSVIYKVHPSQPQTAYLTAICIERAARKTEMPTGVFASLFVASLEIGLQIVSHPLIKAVGFTGSFNGGKALFDAAVRRPEPIPVYAEMSSINPVFILPGQLAGNAESIASTLVASNVLGAGQFCTNPGLIIMIGSENTDRFLALYAEKLMAQPTHRMLTPAIYQSYTEGIAQLKETKGAFLLTEREANIEQLEQPVPAAIRVSGRDFLSNPLFSKEYFGPAAVLVVATDKREFLEIAAALDGQLTASVWCTEGDIQSYTMLFQILEDKAGRLIVNGAPTGVEVCHAMVHGGPFPATSDGRTTSVGTQAIYRFTRPVSYQNFPEQLLPVELRNDNPHNIWRLINGQLSKEQI